MGGIKPECLWRYHTSCSQGWAGQGAAPEVTDGTPGVAASSVSRRASKVKIWGGESPCKISSATKNPCWEHVLCPRSPWHRKEGKLRFLCSCCCARVLSELLWQVTLSWLLAEVNWDGAGTPTPSPELCQRISESRQRALPPSASSPGTKQADMFNYLPGTELKMVWKWVLLMITAAAEAQTSADSGKPVKSSRANLISYSFSISGGWGKLCSRCWFGPSLSGLFVVNVISLEHGG